MVLEKETLKEFNQSKEAHRRLEETLKNLDPKKFIKGKKPEKKQRLKKVS